MLVTSYVLACKHTICAYWQMLIYVCAGMSVFVVVCVSSLLAKHHSFIVAICSQSRSVLEPMVWLDLSYYDVKRF